MQTHGGAAPTPRPELREGGERGEKQRQDWNLGVGRPAEQVGPRRSPLSLHRAGLRTLPGRGLVQSGRWAA